HQLSVACQSFQWISLPCGEIAGNTIEHRWLQDEVAAVDEHVVARWLFEKAIDLRAFKVERAVSSQGDYGGKSSGAGMLPMKSDGGSDIDIRKSVAIRHTKGFSVIK